ncbi:MAG: hypothetical protein C4289_14435, partial [Chloroflexota bacterium]
MARISVQAGGLRIGDRFVPLLSGEVQFWRLDPAHWAPVLDAVRDAGIPIVATYLSWRRHAPDPERPPDFSGRNDPRLNVTGFLDLCRQQGLWVHLKPGPWICAEEPGGGYPDWLLADAFGRNVPRARTRWIEPAWRLIPASKAFLSLLWYLFPDHPNLLPAFMEPGKIGGPEIAKPLWGR